MSHPPSSSDPLGTLLRPRSVAIVGASDNPGKIGGRPLHYLLKHGFQGAVYPISQRGGLVQGVASYPSLEALPQAPDCAILSVPAEAALVQIEACARLGVRNAILFSSGFGEMGSHGLEQQGELLAAARAGGVRLLGPNTIGAANFSCGAILSFASIYQDFQPLDGPVAIVSQSGAVGASAYALLRQNSIGVRYVCTTGNQADIDVCEFMTATLADPAVRLLLLYLEEARNLATLEAGLALARARGVPILVLQGAQSASGARMASCHTGAGGMRDPALSALFDRYSCRRVNGLPELTASVPLYLGSGSTRDAGPGIGIVSNSGASCVMAADACDQMLLPIAQFTPVTVAVLDGLLPPFSRSRNPVDLTAMLLTQPSLLGLAVTAVLDDPACGALALSLLAVAGEGYDVPRFAADTAQALRDTGKAAVFSSPDPRLRTAFAAEGVAVFGSEQEAIGALRGYTAHRLHLETP